LIQDSLYQRENQDQNYKVQDQESDAQDQQDIDDDQVQDSVN